MEIELVNKFASVHSSVANAPGPIYDPPFDPKQKNYPVYSFGNKKEKENESALTKPTSTPINVGPGLYEQNTKILSTLKNDPKVSFNRTAKMSLGNKMQYVHETYEQYSAISNQIRSNKRNDGYYKFDKADRSVRPGIFKQDMSRQPPKLQLPHAHY